MSTLCTISTRATQVLSSTKTKILRIVLTGGPCSGKSSALPYLTQHLECPVYCAPETATLLNNTGLMFDPQNTYEQHKVYQLAICRLNLAMEEAISSVAASRHERAVVLCDRGIIDNKGYMSDELWHDVIRTIGTTEETILNNYAGVVHMDTAAKGALKFYKSGETVDDSGNTVFRRESPEEAIALDDKMWAVYAKHSHQYRVPNQSNNKEIDPFQVKLRATAQAVNAIIEAYEK